MIISEIQYPKIKNSFHSCNSWLYNNGFVVFQNRFRGREVIPSYFLSLLNALNFNRIKFFCNFAAQTVNDKIESS